MDNIRSLIESGQGSISFTVTAEALRAYGIAIAQEVLNAQAKAKDSDAILLTVEEAGELLKASRTALWRWEKKGILKPIKIGRSVRYRKSDLEELAKKKGGEK